MIEKPECKDLPFMRLFDFYAPLLTEHQREITDLYFNYDLSLGEIAEEKGVSRQSVSDCLNKSRRQLADFEKKLGFYSIMQHLIACNDKKTALCNKWINDFLIERPECASKLSPLITELKNIDDEFKGSN